MIEKSSNSFDFYNDVIAHESDYDLKNLPNLNKAKELSYSDYKKKLS